MFVDVLIIRWNHYFENMRITSIISIIFLFLKCTPIAYNSGNYSESNEAKLLQHTDRTYEPQIKTVRLFNYSPDPQSEISPAVTRMGNWSLLLEFDDLHTDRDSYYARIIHCNRDWTPSRLADLDFLSEYNEFPIIDFAYSSNTQIPYVHYAFRLPAVKLPGNYLIVVYRGSDRNDIILSRRFMVFDPQLRFALEDNLIGAGSLTRRNQQINFNLTYKNVELLNPMETVNVTIRQNQRWDNQVENIKPSFIRENIQELEYRFFDGSNMMPGGNEFRFFDLRSIQNPGQNVFRVDRNIQPYRAVLMQDRSRAGDVYSIYPELNGHYIIQNYDFNDLLNAQYCDVEFSLASPQPLPGDVYVVGAFNFWQLNNQTKMVYDSALKMYKKLELLKQGYYNYHYVVKSDKLEPNHLEGSHFETENLYEVFVYYRSFQPMADLLVGYHIFTVNGRN